MAQQLLVWLLAVVSPSLFSRLRPLLYAFSATFPTVSGVGMADGAEMSHRPMPAHTAPMMQQAQVQSSPLFSRSLSVVSCSTPASPAFWASQLLASGVPWLVVHALLFPLTVNQGIVVHGVGGAESPCCWPTLPPPHTCTEPGGPARCIAPQIATALLLRSNGQRCASALQQCPPAGPLMVKAAGMLQRLTIFSGRPADQGGCSGWEGEHCGGLGFGFRCSLPPTVALLLFHPVAQPLLTRGSKAAARQQAQSQCGSCSSDPARVRLPRCRWPPTLRSCS